MVVDGYGSHTLVPSVLKKFKDRRILMITMPSHTSHELQPLDVSCFKPTKYYFSWCLRLIFGTKRVQEIQKQEAPTYFELALSEGCKPSTIINGFRATGIFPYNPNFVEHNPQKFQMADTLDQDKMNAKLSMPAQTALCVRPTRCCKPAQKNLGVCLKARDLCYRNSSLNCVNPSSKFWKPDTT